MDTNYKPVNDDKHLVPKHTAKRFDDDFFMDNFLELSDEEALSGKKSQKWEQWKQFFSYLFDFRLDKENDLDILDSIRADVDFSGTKLWLLVCAILVASLGLNVNSTAVIIGAMLISPLMGPIVGFGTALGIYDFELLKRSLKHLALTALFSILTATIYFLVSPVKTPTSELMNRFNPTVYDVLIAFFGGAAGIIAISTKSKGQVLPGVAIATALMPPLCTVGFGIANGHWSNALGALYLFVINSIFIAFATYVVGIIIKLPKKNFLDPRRGKKVKHIIWAIAICTIAPSVYLSVRIFSEDFMRQRVERYVKENFHFPATTVLRQTISKENGKTKLNVVLLGEILDGKTIDSLQALMPKYDLAKVALNIQQGFTAQKGSTDMGELRNVVLKDLYENSEEVILRQRQQIDSLKKQLADMDRDNLMRNEVSKEIKVLFPEVGQLLFTAVAGEEAGKDSVVHIVIKPLPKALLKEKDINKIERWMAARTGHKYAKVIVDRSTR